MEATNPNRISFIICTNDEDKFNECEAWIRRLNVPERMTMDIIPIRDAKSICEGYNRGMNSSDAKYKIYMHHDVFILDKNMPEKIIACFERNPKAGLIGMVGRKELPKDDYLFRTTQWGAAYETHIHETTSYYLYSNAPEDEKVLHVDGMLIATCVDIPWREDIFDGWDLYDTSQSMEMKRRGYEVVIPYMEKPMVLHDCGYLSLSGYDVQKEKFVREYSEFFNMKFD